MNEKLRQASSYNRSLIEASLDPLVTIGPNGQITDVNAATERVTGCSRQELIGTDFSDYFTDPDKARKGYEQAFREGMVRDYALNVRHKDGHLTPVLYNASVYKDDAGKVMGVFAAARDVTEQKLAAEALQESEDKFKYVFDHSMIGKSITLPTGDIQVNKAFCEMLGYTLEELQNSRWQDITHPEDVALNQKMLEPIIAGKLEAVRFIKRYLHKDGSVVWGDVGTSLRRDGEGQPLYFMTSVSDITERIRAEEALRRAYAYNRSLIEVSLDPLVTIGDDGKITDVNAATELATGFGRHELIGTDFSDYFTEPEKARSGYGQVFQEGAVRDYPLEIRHRQGNTVPVLYNASVYKDEAGHVAGIFAAARDITEQKKSEAKLHKTTRALEAISGCNQALVHAVEEAVLLQDICRHIVEVGGYRFAWVGYADEDEAKSVRPMAKAGFEDGYLETVRITWADKERGRGPTGMAIRTGRICLARNILIDPNFAPWREAAAQRGYVSACVLPLIIDDRVIGTLNIYATEADAFNDEEVQLLTQLADDLAFGIKSLRVKEDLRRYQESLEYLVEARTAELKSSNNELEAFSYSVSHDLRAPLRAVDGFSQMLEEDYTEKLDAEGKRILDVIRDEVKKMGQLIDDLLSFSRIGRREMNLSQIDMHSLAQLVYNELMTAAPGRNIQLICGSLPPAHGDAALVRQLLINLVANAIKFTRPRERAVIELGGQTGPEENSYFVRDDGVGFDMQYAHKLFGVFQRLHTDEEFEGTGVGLAIVQRIVHRHGGRTWAEGGVGLGATFHFTLPGLQTMPRYDDAL